METVAAASNISESLFATYTLQYLLRACTLLKRHHPYQPYDFFCCNVVAHFFAFLSLTANSVFYYRAIPFIEVAELRSIVISGSLEA